MDKGTNMIYIRKLAFFLLLFLSSITFAQKVLELEKVKNHNRHRYIKARENVVCLLKDSTQKIKGVVTRITDSLIYINEMPIKLSEIEMIGFRNVGKRDFIKALISYGVTTIAMVASFKRDKSGFPIYRPTRELFFISVAGLRYGTFSLCRGIFLTIKPHKFYSTNWKMRVTPAPHKGIKFFKGII